MHATRDTGKTRPEREVDQKAGEDKERHAHEVDPVSYLHGQRMCLLIVCEMCLYLTPQGLVTVSKCLPVAGSDT